MSGILLTHSFLLRFDPKQHRLGQPYAPLGTLYAGAVLREEGLAPDFHDMTFARDTGDLELALDRKKPDILVLYEDGFNYLTKMCLSNMRQASFRMAALAKARGAAVVVCSPDASDHSELYLRAGADYVIRGEGEEILKVLASRLASGHANEIRDIPGVAMKSRDGIVINPPGIPLADLDRLPFPAWDMLDMDRYRDTWRSKNDVFTLNMVTTRGCPYQCVWCSKPVYSNHYNSRSPGNVVQEMKYLVSGYSPDTIWFADDIFGLKPGWVEEFEFLVNAEGLRIPYTIQTRVDLLLEDRQIGPLARSGCRKAWIGIESGSQNILDVMRKGTTVDQAREASPKLREAGIEQAFFLQLGFPGETREDIRKTIRLLTELMPDDIGISITYPLPGTKLYEEVSRELKGKKNWTDSDDLTLLFSNRFSPRWYKILHRYIHKYFRFRQGLWYAKAILTRNRRLSRPHLRRILLMPYYLLMAGSYKLMLTVYKDGAR